MAEMHLEEKCPCGSNISVSGYSSYVQPQILTWRSIHNKHMNAIAKSIASGAIAEHMKWPFYYVAPPIPGTNPNPWWQNPIITFETNTNTGTTKQT